MLLSTNWTAYRSHGRLKVTVESKPEFPKSIFSCSVFVPIVARTRLKSVRFRDCYPMGLVKTLSVYMFFAAAARIARFLRWKRPKSKPEPQKQVVVQNTKSLETNKVNQSNNKLYTNKRMQHIWQSIEKMKLSNPSHAHRITLSSDLTVAVRLQL